MSFQNQISLNTKGHGDMKDITEQVAAVVNSSGIKTGIANVFNIGSTAAVGTIEFEPGLQRDMPAILDKLIPPSRNYGHEQTWHDGNGHSHLQATLLGPSLTVPIADGKLVLGTWQQIFHLECDVRGADAPSWGRWLEIEDVDAETGVEFSAMPKRAPARRRPRKAKPGAKGLGPAECRLEKPAGAVEVSGLIEKSGGCVVGFYKEPLGGHPVLLSILPIDAVEPTLLTLDIGLA